MNDLVAKLRSSIPSEALGVEIGAHSLPIEGLTPYYIDRVAQFAGTNGVVDILADACALPLRSESLDYLCSSHVLEHLSEPLTSLWEWHRVLRRGGFLYLVVPDKRFTFDHTRKVTDTSHHLEEFLHGSSVAASREHIRQFIYDTDWARLQPASVAENAKVERDAHYQHWVSVLSSGEGLDIHYHTFTPVLVGCDITGGWIHRRLEACIRRGRNRRSVTRAQRRGTGLACCSGVVVAIQVRPPIVRPLSPQTEGHVLPIFN